MAKINDNFLKLPGSYLFANIAQKVAKFKKENPDSKVIKLGIGDVTQPLPQASIDAMHAAIEDLATKERFHGYGPEQGYKFLQDTIIDNDYKPLGIDFDSSEIFVSDGAKSDTGNIGDILATDNKVGVTDPIYPVYIDSNVMGGRSGNLQENGMWSNITYTKCTAENSFIPELPKEKVDIMYLCYPNNPTGTTLTRNQLKEWVDWALANEVLILFDSAYEAYITEENVPHSIYEIDGAKKCAIEFRSFSKTAGFTGVRCGYTVVPKELMATTNTGEKVAINKIWNRRQCTKFNGASYITQRGAEATYSEQGKEQVKMTIDFYMGNAKIMKEELEAAGLTTFGGLNAPYVWVKTPKGMTSWDFFDEMLHKANVVGTPGVGFGPSGEGYYRLSAFGEREDCLEAMKRIKNWLKK